MYEACCATCKGELIKLNASSDRNKFNEKE